MGHGKALALKLVYTTLILFAVFTFFGHHWMTNILVAAIVVTGFLYVIGDLWILPNFGSGAATLTNAVLAGLIIWATELILVGFGLAGSVILISAALIGVGEHFFHLWMERQTLTKRPDKRGNT